MFFSYYIHVLFLETMHFQGHVHGKRWCSDAVDNVLLICYLCLLLLKPFRNILICDFEL